MKMESSLNTVLITGATGAIGAALARLYATAVNTLILFGRNESKLEQLAMQCRNSGSRVLCYTSDIVDSNKFIELLSNVSEREKPDLVIANAGVSSTADKDGESWQRIEEVVKVNILATMATVQSVLPLMKARKKGQIAIISSLAAWYGLPTTPAYSASKAAIKNYGEALRAANIQYGIKVNLVMPGFVESAMSRTMPGSKPFMLTAEQAAIKIRKGLEMDRPRISFPFPMNLGCWLLAVLPPSVSAWLLKRFGYNV